MRIASAKSQSARGASHQPAYMGSCLTISHTCLPRRRSGRTLFWSNLLVAGKVVSREGEKGRRVVSWEGEKGGRIVRWQGAKGGRVVKWQGRFLVLFKSGGCRVSPRFHLFVFDVDQQWKEEGGFKIIGHGHRDGKTVLRSNTSC